MPINNKTFLHFGRGDISIAVIRNTSTGEIHNEVIFVQTEEGSIGRDNPEFVGMDVESVDYSVRMSFSCVESLDVLLEMLNMVRDSMINARRLP